MAINYGNVFALLGEWVERTNEFQALYATIDSYETEVNGDYAGQSQYTLMASIPEVFSGFKSSVRSWISLVNNQAIKVLNDEDLVRGQLPLVSISIEDILDALIKDMNDQSENVLPNTVTVSAVTATTSGADAGTLLVSKVLDGYNDPSTAQVRIRKNRYYNELDSEVSYDDAVTVKCISDSETGLSEGSESWVAIGSIYHDPFGWKDEGSGMARGITTLNSVTSTYILNPDFETFSSNTPQSWDIDAGTAGVHIFQGSGADAWRGSYALKLTGDGAQAAITLSQAVIGQLHPRRRYLFACYVKGTAGIAAGNLVIKFTGTDYTASSSEKIDMNAAALAAQTTYGLEYFWINMPDNVPDDLAIEISVSGTLTNAKDVCIDGIAFGPAIYENGVAMAIVASADKFLVGDQFTFTVTNNDAGVFQTWFRKTFGVQLPSDGTPTINDSLAT